MKRHPFVIVLWVCLASTVTAQQRVPPYDLWTDPVMSDIRNANTLEVEITSRGLYYDVYFTSNPSAGYPAPPDYSKLTTEKIRIHAYLALPFGPGPYPAIVIGHGHGGHADLTLAQQIATFFGYAALAIDGPQAGLSTGGPHDDNQAWISVDDGPQYGYLYHYAYAGMRALTLLEYLAGQSGNPYRIDKNRLAVLGASMGGILTTHINGIDSRVKAAIAVVAAGNWLPALRYPNGWLYHGLYASTKDQPYNGSDPVNSIENVYTDPTAITFMNYFDPIRYAPTQHAPILTIIGTHDQYFPLPGANLQQLAFGSAETHTNFEKRLWLIPNGTHGLESASSLVSVASGVQQWLEYAFGNRADRPVPTPQVSLSSSGSGLRFEITAAAPFSRLAASSAVLQVATRVDSTVTPINDFKAYTAAWQNDRYVVTLPVGEKTASGDTITVDNALYFATITESSLPVSSLMYKGGSVMDISTAFEPKIDQWPSDKIVAPVPPLPVDAAEGDSSSVPNASVRAYQGMALSNPGDKGKAIRIEARTPDGRVAAADGLINPVAMYLPPKTQRVFVAEEWFGRGIGKFDGTLRAFWSDAPQSSLAFRGSDRPTELDGIGPARPAATSLWLLLAPEQDAAAARKIRLFGGAAASNVTITYRNSAGSSGSIPGNSVTVPAWGTVDVTPPTNAADTLKPASAEIKGTTAVSARLEVSGARDPWSIEARPAPSATRYYQPHTEWNGIYTTRLVMLNPSAGSRQVRVHLRTAGGEEIGSGASLALAALSVVNTTVEALFPGASGKTGPGWIDIEAPDGAVLVEAIAADAKTGASASSAIEAGGTGTWSMPFYVESLGYWTGLAIANPGGQSATLTIRALDRAGKELGSWSGSLGPYQSRTQLVSQWIQGLPGGTTGQIIITVSSPVTLLAYFGTDDGAALAAIPFTAVP